MAKKKSWFNLVKRLFIWDTHSAQDKREKRRKWIFGRLNSKSKRLPSIKAPLASKGTKLCEAEEEQSKHALTVAIASAAEVVRLTEEAQREIKESAAAIKIQNAFRGYLARKALRALKGIVKLQAIIRGRAVRRQAMSTLKCLQSIVSIQSHVCARRLRMVEGRCHYAENEVTQDSKDKIIRMDSNSESKWDGSSVLKEEVDTSCISSKKKERKKEYSYNHRRSAESERSKVNGRWRYWLEQWVDTQLSKSKEFEDLDSVCISHSRAGEEFGGRQLKLTSIQRQSPVEGLDSRKYFPHGHRRQCSVGEENSFPSSPATPAYMAATESAKAKAKAKERTTSSPKIRTGGNVDINSDSYSPCKKKLSISSGRMGKLSFSSNQQRSPSFKGLSLPIKSTPTNHY